MKLTVQVLGYLALSEAVKSAVASTFETTCCDLNCENCQKVDIEYDPLPELTPYDPADACLTQGVPVRRLTEANDGLTESERELRSISCIFFPIPLPIPFPPFPPPFPLPWPWPWPWDPLPGPIIAGYKIVEQCFDMAAAKAISFDLTEGGTISPNFDFGDGKHHSNCNRVDEVSCSLLGLQKAGKNSECSGDPHFSTWQVRRSLIQRSEPHRIHPNTCTKSIPHTEFLLSLQGEGYDYHGKLITVVWSDVAAPFKNSIFSLTNCCCR
jgi:hypothetical protein